MIDAERVEIEIGNHVDLLFHHLRGLEAMCSQPLTKDEKERLAKTANIFASRSIGLANHARRVMQSYPRLS